MKEGENIQSSLVHHNRDPKSKEEKSDGRKLACERKMWLVLSIPRKSSSHKLAAIDFHRKSGEHEKEKV